MTKELNTVFKGLDKVKATVLWSPSVASMPVILDHVIPLTERPLIVRESFRELFCMTQPEPCNTNQNRELT
jgi:hypothetical protein